MSNKDGYIIGGIALTGLLGGAAYLATRKPTVSSISPVPSSGTIDLQGVLSVSSASIIAGQSVTAHVLITTINGNAPVPNIPVIIKENTTSVEGTILTDANGKATMSVSFEGAGDYSLTGYFPSYVVN